MQTRAKLTTSIAAKRGILYARYMNKLEVPEAVKVSELIEDMCKLWHEREMIKLNEAKGG